MFKRKCDKCELQSYAKHFEKYRIDSVFYQMSMERMARLERENAELKKILFEKCGEEGEERNEQC